MSHSTLNFQNDFIIFILNNSLHHLMAFPCSWTRLTQQTHTHSWAPRSSKNGSHMVSYCSETLQAPEFLSSHCRPFTCVSRSAHSLGLNEKFWTLTDHYEKKISGFQDSEVPSWNYVQNSMNISKFIFFNPWISPRHQSRLLFNKKKYYSFQMSCVPQFPSFLYSHSHI